jgi:hypothetical protein
LTTYTIDGALDNLLFDPEAHDAKLALIESKGKTKTTSRKENLIGPSIIQFKRKSLPRNQI